MAAAALRLLRSMCTSQTSPPPVLVFIRCCSSAAAGSEGAAIINSKDEGAGIQYCYALGKFGKLRFDHRLFVPIEEVMRKTPAFEAVPDDRFIDVVDPWQSTLTAEVTKEWIRSGYLAPFFTKKLGLTIKNAFADGNVGVIAGLNIIAFLELDISTSASTAPEKYPMPYAGFSDFLSDKIKEVYGMSTVMLPSGFRGLMKISRQNVFDDLVIYHPEFLPLEGMAALFIQIFRIVRREMPALSEGTAAADMIIEIDSQIPQMYAQRCSK